MAGIPVHERSVSAAQLQETVASGCYLAIALVDKATLGLGTPQSWLAGANPDDPNEVAYVGERPTSTPPPLSPRGQP